MSKYDEMNDFEVNKAVAINRGGYCGHVEHMAHGVKEADGLFYTERDYCNNPSDARPIIIENQISIIKYEGLDKWEALGGGVYVDYDHNIISEAGCAQSCANPLRAAMIVFLMMQEAAHG